MSGDPGGDSGLPRGVIVERGGMRATGRLVFGLALVALGLLWTLENLDVPGSREVLRWWPALLVSYGFIRFTGIDGTRRLGSGALFMLVGGWMLAREFGLIRVSIFSLWPAWLIFLGSVLVWRSMHVPGSGQNVSDRSAYPRPFAFMGGNTRKVDSQDLVGIEATAVMGGVEADLTPARTRGREVIAEVFAWWGGIELIVPDDWRVVSEVIPVMGGVEDSTKFTGQEPAATLVVRGLVVMGGVEIKNAKGRRGMKVGAKVNLGGSEGRRKEVRVDDSDVTVESGDAPPPSPQAPPPPVS